MSLEYNENLKHHKIYRKHENKEIGNSRLKDLWNLQYSSFISQVFQSSKPTFMFVLSLFSRCETLKVRNPHFVSKTYIYILRTWAIDRLQVRQILFQSVVVRHGKHLYYGEGMVRHGKPLAYAPMIFLPCRSKHNPSSWRIASPRRSRCSPRRSSCNSSATCITSSFGLQILCFWYRWKALEV